MVEGNCVKPEISIIYETVGVWFQWKSCYTVGLRGLCFFDFTVSMTKPAEAIYCNALAIWSNLPGSLGSVTDIQNRIKI